MARTAPAPNIPAIPGMNPGVFVMGGGGGGGGGSGKGGRGSGGGQGADGQNGGDGADGGGEGSGACGQGNTGSCTNCGNQFAAGDPVDVATGRVFTPPKRDLSLPGFFSFDITRAYSTTRRHIDQGTGYGWALSIDWQLTVGRRSVHVKNGVGLDLHFPMLREPGDQASRDGCALIRVKDGFILRPGNEFFHHFRRHRDGKYRIMAASWRNRGAITFHHAHGRLARIVDTAGRTILLQRNRDGRLTSLVVPAEDGRRLTFARYEYSDRGDLASVTDADGHVWRFEYDDDHSLVTQRFPTGMVFHYRYDAAGRCIETWGNPESGAEPSLDPQLPAVLADGRTKAKGILHTKLDFATDGFSEVTTSTAVLRFEHSPGGIQKAVDGVGGVTSRTHDPFGRVQSHTDANGATTVWQHDGMGAVTRETDPDGRAIACERDMEGRPLEVWDPAGGRIVFERDAWGNEQAMTDQAGGVTRYTNDDRGMVVERVGPGGELTKFEYDGHGNLVAETLPSGDVRRYRYDYWGRLAESQLPTGSQTTYEWYPSGRLARSTDSLGQSYGYTYDGLGNITSCALPDGGHTKLHWGGVSWLYAVENADGSRATATFNREGWPLVVESENGATHTYEYDSAGRAVCETTFNGAIQRVGLDMAGRPVWSEDSRGRTEYERNHAGQLVREVAPDGSERRYEYDAVGELVFFTNGQVSFAIERNALGDVVRQTMLMGAERYEVNTPVDHRGLRSGVISSIGLGVEYQRDVLGRVLEIAEDATRLASTSYDLDTRRTHRILPKGGVMSDTYDAEGRIRRRQVLSKRSDLGSEPSWVGDFVGNVDERYDYTASDEIALVESKHGGKTAFEYDARRRIASKDQNGRRETWAHDGGSNHYEADPLAPPRRYASGDKLVAHGDVEFVYDDDGFLVEKRRPKGADVERWRYRWGPWRELEAVECPDGTTIEFVYDTFMRRVAKRILQDGKVVSSTLWVWDGNGPVHEVVTDGVTGEQRTTTFVYDDDSETIPFAQREGEGDWVFYVKGVGGAPSNLVTASGDVLSHIERTTYGRLLDGSDAPATTPFRFEGQYEDAETSLFYNRYRYYDPDTGRYISPDPLGIAAGRNLYAYARNPIGWIDPTGLHGLMVEASDVPGMPAGHTTSSGTGDFHPNDQFFRMPHQARLHSERAMLNQMRQIRERSERAGEGNPLEGRRMRVRGSKPPCPNCHRAMHAFVEQNQMAGIDYVWQERPHGGDSAVRYEPGRNPQFGGYDSSGTWPDNFSQSRAGQHAQQLRDNYAMTGGNIRPGSRRDVNRETHPGGYTYVPPSQQAGGVGAQDTYRDLNANYPDD